ncbi:MAG: potassium-transporting ATPase subunit KdpC [Erysipelotrichia bacterium]|nr:potassium-transporting ATPase subunit KdpC [Erysipelotrichia bacterium]NCC54957.1 potassium-transporting ATPase subunit KdpC [Erysipelotrichia bacterium]
MKKSKSMIKKAIGVLLVFSVICGVVYPTGITLISQVFLKDQANGSIIEVNGKKYGSALLAQQFTSDEYMWGRVMNIDTQTYTEEDGTKRMYATASNISPASDEYDAMIKERVKKIRKAHPQKEKEQIPSDLITISGSGLDPQISLKAAKFQMTRIAKARHMSEKEVSVIVEQYTQHKLLGFLGEETVNVLKVNLALDGILK